MPNPEEAVIADIDALIDESLAAGPTDDYDVNNYDRCPHCTREWHGVPQGGCPGSHIEGPVTITPSPYTGPLSRHVGRRRQVLSPEMREALRTHLRLWPEDEERLVCQFGTAWLTSAVIATSIPVTWAVTCGEDSDVEDLATALADARRVVEIPLSLEWGEMRAGIAAAFGVSEDLLGPPEQLNSTDSAHAAERWVRHRLSEVLMEMGHVGYNEASPPF